jgi:hypothetical protein
VLPEDARGGDQVGLAVGTDVGQARGQQGQGRVVEVVGVRRCRGLVGLPSRRVQVVVDRADGDLSTATRLTTTTAAAPLWPGNSRSASSWASSSVSVPIQTVTATG